MYWFIFFIYMNITRYRGKLEIRLEIRLEIGLEISLRTLNSTFVYSTQNRECHIIQEIINGILGDLFLNRLISCLGDLEWPKFFDFLWIFLKDTQYHVSDKPSEELKRNIHREAEKFWTVMKNVIKRAYFCINIEESHLSDTIFN